MAVGIFQGSTPRLTFTLLNGVKASTLGTPIVYIRQGLVEESFPATVSGNTAYVDLTASFTAQLNDRDDCDVQVEWTSSSGKVVRFPIHKVPVNESILPEA